MAFLCLEYLFSFKRYLRFCELSDDVTGGFNKAAQHSIKKFSRNMKVLFFKPGIRTVNHKRSK